jgi:hypothetical protein
LQLYNSQSAAELSACVRPHLRPSCATVGPEFSFRLVAVRLQLLHIRLVCRVPGPPPVFCPACERAAAPRLRAASSHIDVRILPEPPSCHPAPDATSIVDAEPLFLPSRPLSRAAGPAAPCIPPAASPRRPSRFRPGPRASFALRPTPLLPPLWQPIARRSLRVPLLWTLHSFRPLSAVFSPPLCALWVLLDVR